MRLAVTLKLATSLDGRIATASGESRWITGPEAREQVHRLRAMHRMILVGVETAIADDPELTVRLPGYVGGQPTRVVLDSRQRLPPDSRLAASADRIPTVVVTLGEAKARLTAAGVAVLKVAQKEGRVDVAAALDALEAYREVETRDRVIALAGSGASEMLTRMASAALRAGDVMVEGGGQVAASFLEAGLVDRIEWFRAPIVLGDEGRPAVGAFVLEALARAPRFRRTHVEALGDDLWERYERP